MKICGLVKYEFEKWRIIVWILSFGQWLNMGELFKSDSIEEIETKFNDFRNKLGIKKEESEFSLEDFNES